VADIISDGFTRVLWIASGGVVSIAAPTVAELDAGITLHSTMTSDGLVNFRPTTNSVPNRKLDSKYNTVDVGSIAMADGALRFYKQDGTDTIYDTLLYRVDGTVAVRRSLDAATANAADQKWQMYPVRCGEVSWLEPEDDTEERYEIPVKFWRQPNLRAVAAA
jgi:hypothetical protein